MYIQKITIKNYRNFNDFTMDFHEGLNVIVGANNSGKTGLLSAINLLNEPSNISFEDFNKNNLLQFENLYKEEAPIIEIVYYINHNINEEDTSDEGILKLVPFLGFNEVGVIRGTSEDEKKYCVTAIVKATFALDVKYMDEYKKQISDITSFESYASRLNYFVDEHYKWTYTNSVSEVKIEAKEANGIFDIRFIGAERTAEEVAKETRREIDSFTKESGNIIKLDEFKDKVSKELETILNPSIEKMTKLFEIEQNDIGLKNGNVSIRPSVKARISIPDSFITEVEDTKSKYIIPIDHNGLGYNNLINIYMLIRLNEIKTGKDFRILCLEEPEAHLHPAMQYKLFKYLTKLDDANNLKQQIFVTTHSSNISAVAGIDNMFMLAYNRSNEVQDCVNQSLETQFIDSNGTNDKSKAKKHLSKFLDVTRSDMLFADKVILVEGIAEKLLMPYFMEKHGCSYEDEHVSIVEIGGKHFEHFIELFNGNALKKKVLCITDKDFSWKIEEEKIVTQQSYVSYTPGHIKNLKQKFNFNEFKLCTQKNGGTTFEDELFLANYNNEKTGIKLLKIALPETLHQIADTCKLNMKNWEEKLSNIDGRTKPTIQRLIDNFNRLKQADKENILFYEKMFFSSLFLNYAQTKKGDVALQILTEIDQSELVVPEYISEGLEWLK